MIRQGVAKNTGDTIGRQNDRDLLAIMNSVYSVNSYNPYSDVEKQTSWLNQVTANKGIQQVTSGVLMYKQFIKDIDRLPMPNDLPRNTSTYGKKIGTNNKW
jgi:hypothetical protein